jgi:hypothetical protein
MFSLATDLVFAPPRPEAPMIPIFNLSFAEAHWPGLVVPATQMPTPARAVFLRKRRRFVRRFIGGLLDCGEAW